MDYDHDLQNTTGECNFLKNPISIRDLLNGGCDFEMHSNFDEAFVKNIYDEENMFCDEDDENITLDENQLVSPWLRPFEELKEHMIEINPYVWKRITKLGCRNEDVVPDRNARVNIRYNAYWEGAGAPFDSSFLRGSTFTFYTGLKEVIEGLEIAVCTMRRGEHAEFLISYHKLFHEMGCPPRIQPKANGLFIIELVSYNIVGDINAEKKISEVDRNKYNMIKDKVKDIHLKGLDFFGQKMYRNASRAFEKALDILKFSLVANETERLEQKTFLLKLCTNLAVCYNKLEIPNKTCLICKEIRQITQNNPSCKALFQEGRALLMLGEFAQSRQLLIKAQNMEPQNNDISKELKLLDDTYGRYKDNQRKLWTKAIGITKDISTNEVKKSYSDLKLENNLQDIMLDFKNNDNRKEMKLPCLTKQEIEIASNLAKSLNLRLLKNHLNNYCVKLVKI